jgi:DNA-binding MarR family transcriptional regulator
VEANGGAAAARPVHGPAAELAEALADVVPRLYRLLRTALDAEPGAASLEQLRVMSRIDGGLHHVSALAAARQMRMSAITAIIDVLAERGWVVRLPDATDRRRTFVELTEDGRGALGLGREITRQRMEAILGGYRGNLEEAGRVVSQLTTAVSEFDTPQGGWAAAGAAVPAGDPVQHRPPSSPAATH